MGTLRRSPAPWAPSSAAATSSSSSTATPPRATTATTPGPSPASQVRLSNCHDLMLDMGGDLKCAPRLGIWPLRRPRGRRWRWGRARPGRVWTRPPPTSPAPPAATGNTSPPVDWVFKLQKISECKCCCCPSFDACPLQQLRESELRMRIFVDLKAARGRRQLPETGRWGRRGTGRRRASSAPTSGAPTTPPPSPTTAPHPRVWPSVPLRRAWFTGLVRCRGGGGLGTHLCVEGPGHLCGRLLLLCPLRSLDLVGIRRDLN